MTRKENTFAALGSLILVTTCLLTVASPAQAGLGYGRQAPPADASTDHEGLIGDRIQSQERAVQKNPHDLTPQGPTTDRSSDRFGPWWVGAAALLLPIAAVATVVHAARKPSASPATGPGGR